MLNPFRIFNYSTLKILKCAAGVGKTLTPAGLSTLAHYYDVNRKDEFTRLFGDLEIGGRPTVARNSYLVLELDFHRIDSPNM
ncbi:MAG TPA: hypothetical protein VHY08_22875 [Bacillota bacterium]|nr:hypothetical protein [Bacillota bacterium]